MNAILSGLVWVAQRGRFVLPVGLAAGLTLPELAQLMRVWLPEMVATLLLLTAFRIGARAAFGAISDFRLSLRVLVVFQMIIPLGATLVLLAFGVAQAPLATAAVLMLAASPVAGSPNLCILSDQPPAPALRLTILGTAFLPLTILPVFALHPAFASGQEILMPAQRLLVTILGAGALGFVLRHVLLRNPSARAIQGIDGAAALVLAVMVIGLMSAVGPGLRAAPGQVLFWLACAFALNFGMQILSTLVLRRTSIHAISGSLGIVAGNRNIALFLVALPEATTAPILLFIGCYQFPMYLTPLLMRRFYGTPAPGV